MMDVKLVLRVAYITTVAQSLVGVVLAAVYNLAYFCTIPVSCPGSGKVEQVAFIFYTTYVRDTDSDCEIQSGNETLLENTSNENKLTEPKMILFWQVLYLCLYLGWAGTALVLQKLEKQKGYAVPWLVVTLLVLISDLVASALTISDFTYGQTEQTTFQCPAILAADLDWLQKVKTWTTSLLLLYFSRAGLVWLTNLAIFLTLVHILMSKDSKVPQTLSTEQLWPRTPAPHQVSGYGEVGLEHHSEEQRQPHHQPHHQPQSHHQPHHQPHHQSQPQVHHQHEPKVPLDHGDRRATSFVDRVRQADSSFQPTSRDGALWSYANPGVRKELIARGQEDRGSPHPDQDVDTAFMFLDTYKEGGTIGRGGQTNKLDTYKEGETQGRGGQYSKQLQGGHQTREAGLPRAKVPPAAPVVRPISPDAGPGARYIVPLKN